MTRGGGVTLIKKEKGHVLKSLGHLSEMNSGNYEKGKGHLSE